MGHGASSSRRGDGGGGNSSSSSGGARAKGGGAGLGLRAGVVGSGNAPIVPTSPGSSASKYAVSNSTSAVVHVDACSILPVGSLASKLCVYQNCETMECLVLLEDDDIAGMAGIPAADRPLWIRLQLCREQTQYFTGSGNKFVQLSPPSATNTSSVHHASESDRAVADSGKVVIPPTSTLSSNEAHPRSEKLVQTTSAPHSGANESTSGSVSNRVTAAAPDGIISCEYCHEVVSSDERRQEHYKVCSRAQELISAFDHVNMSLRTILFQVTQQNHSMMQYLLASAVREFEEMTFLDGITLNLVRRVIDVAPGKQSPNSVAALEQELQRRLEQIELEMQRAASVASLPLASAAAQGQSPPPSSKSLAIITDVLTELRRKRSLLKEFTQQSMSVRDYRVIRQLSEGAYSRVFEVIMRDPGGNFEFGGINAAPTNSEPKTYALKVMSKSFIRQQDMVKRVKRESKVMKMTGNGNKEMFVRLYSSFQSRNFLFMVMEHVKGGDFLAQLIKWGRFTEPISRVFIAELVSAVVYLHDHGVVHRDIKIDNLLITERGHLKLTDFGMVTPAISLLERRNSIRSESGASHTGGGSLKSTQEAWLESLSFTDTSREQSDDQSSASFRYNDSSGQLRSAVGNYQYAAPEMVLNLGYDHAVDWWSCGIIFFQFLSGSTPFMDINSEKTIENIARSAVKWELLPQEVSELAKEFIRSLLTFLAHQRLGFRSSDDVKGHQYFAGLNFDALFEGPGPIDPFSLSPNSQSQQQEDHLVGSKVNVAPSAPAPYEQLDVLGLDFYNDPPADTAAANHDEFDSFCIF